jgi:hypothetical protein
MAAIQACELPAGALLRKYVGGGAYADCYVTELAAPVSHADYVEAFYTTAVFGIERWLLARLVSRPSTDAQARELAGGMRDAFAAWTVEGRAANQLLMCDIAGRTRSWLMVANGEASGAQQRTRLYFGSAVVPARRAGAAPAGLGFAFRALLGFHRLYSRVLLRAACARLMRQRGGTT